MSRVSDEMAPHAGRRRVARTAQRRCVARVRGAQSGIALVLALWLTVLLTVIASGFAFSMRSEALATRNAVSLAQARAIAASAVDEAAKIDLNAAPDALLRNVLIVTGGLDEPAANALVDAIADWRDPDELRRPNGAELPEYRAAGLKYGPANAPFETVGEAARVLGMTPAVFRRVARVATVYSRQPGINAAT